MRSSPLPSSPRSKPCVKGQTQSPPVEKTQTSSLASSQLPLKTSSEALKLLLAVEDTKDRESQPSGAVPHTNTHTRTRLPLKGRMSPSADAAVQHGRKRNIPSEVSQHFTIPSPLHNVDVVDGEPEALSESKSTR